MDNRDFMLKLSRLFPSSFTSCQFRNLTDVAETSLPINKLHLSSSLSLSLQNPAISLSPKPPRKPSLHHSSTSNGSCFTTSADDDVDTDTFFSLSSNSGDSFRLPTAASKRFRLRDDMKSIHETAPARCSFSSAASCNKNAATETNGGGGGGGRKPSRTCVELGSDYISTQLYYSGNDLRRRKGGGNRRRVTKKSGFGSAGCGAVVGDSYAVEKRSRDPRGDFRASMVEMVVEKRIFAAEDLERLLRCFLSLNSTSYHGMIFDVFSEICQTLFTN